MTLRSAADPKYIRPLTRLIDRAAGPLDLAGYRGRRRLRRVSQGGDAT